MLDWVKWRTKRNTLGHVDHFLYDTIDEKMLGHVRKQDRIYVARVRGREMFTRKTLKAAKTDVEYMFDKLGVGKGTGDISFEKA
mgnify:CR=1 FL=1